MNILIPHTWLLEELSTKADPATIQKLASLSGPSIERIEEIASDQVYDIEVTTNRVDSMSIRGMAREIAVILAENGIAAQLKPLAVPTVTEPTRDALPSPVIHNNPVWCKRIICVVLDNIQRSPTPEWMVQRLHQIDQREHDAVIDITNYVTHHYGHPIHAFDYDKIMQLGGEIYVTEAKPDQPFVTLDGQSYTTKGGEIVFTNAQGEIIDLPAIKGTANSSIDDNTKRVLLWIESLDAKKVRQASMKHAIRTVAAQLNEKGVDPELAAVTFYKAIELYEQLTDARVASTVYDEYVAPAAKTPLLVPFARIHQYVGLDIAPSRIVEILTSLGCTATLSQEGVLVTPPSFRSDITIAEDVIEEIARIYGYHNIPSVLMDGVPPTQQPEGTNFLYESRIKRVLAVLGAQEMYTYSLVSSEIAAASSLPEDQHLRVGNPLTDNRVILRRTLVPSLEEVLLDQSTKSSLILFELANCYHPQRGTALPLEELHLAIASSDGYRETRAVVERALREFFISLSVRQFDNTALDADVVNHPELSQMLESVLHSQNQHAILKGRSADGREAPLGVLSVLANGHIFFDLLWGQVLVLAESHPHYLPLPKAAPIIEDLTFTFSKETKVGQVIEEMKNASPIISQVKLTSQYQNRSTYRITYQDQHTNLTSEEIAPLRQQLVTSVEQRFKATLVGSLE